MAPTPAQLHAENVRRAEATELPATVSDLLERAAQRYGDADAICFFEDGHSLTFRELNVRVRKLAHALHSIGVRHGTHTAVMLPNRIEFPLIWLALARLGAVMTTVITGSTSRELEFLLKDAEVTHVLIDEAFLPTLNPLIGGSVCPPLSNIVLVGGSGESEFRDFAELLEAGNEKFEPLERPKSSDLLNIQYTSGTTGLPKGVMQSHRFWVQAGCSPALMWQAADIKNILSDHPFYYIDPQWMLLMGLYIGARVDFTKRMSVSKMLGWITSRKTSVAYFPPPLLKSPPDERDRPNSVKLFLAYQFTAEMLVQATSRYGTRFREAYGMTEIGLGLLVPFESTDPDALGTCGFPGPWREVRLVDSEGNDVAPGEPGELWFRGPGISDGYYGRPEANAQTFVDGWFRTGDLFVKDDSGYYRIVGRIKDMIKRSGENIAASEIERVLMTMPEVLEAAALPVPDPDRDEEVKVYLVLREGLTKEDVPPEMILAHCVQGLAKFKVPRYVEYVDRLPHTPSKKVAKQQLIAASKDLRVGSYDAADKLWR